MITFAMVKPLGGLIKHMDIPGLAEKIKSVDLEKINYTPGESEDDNDEKALKAAAEEKEKIGEIIIVELATHLEDVADDLVRLCAAYKGCSFEEMMKQDPLAVLKELLNEEGFADFFKNAVQSVMQK